MRSSTRRHFLNAAIGAVVVSTTRGLCMGEASAAPFVIDSKFVGRDISPDGDLEKPMWAGAKQIVFDQAAFSEAHYPDIKTSVASGWSARFLYLAFWCPYETLTVYQEEDATTERDRLWERDVVEAFIAPDSRSPSHYYEFEIAPNNQWLDTDIDLSRNPINDRHWNSGFEHATRIDAVKRLWTAEMKIPIQTMAREAIRPGVDWRVNFYRCDGPGGDTERLMMSWGRLPVRVSGGTFHQPASFRILRFGDNS